MIDFLFSCLFVVGVLGLAFILTPVIIVLIVLSLALIILTTAALLYSVWSVAGMIQNVFERGEKE